MARDFVVGLYWTTNVSPFREIPFLDPEDPTRGGSGDEGDPVSEGPSVTELQEKTFPVPKVRVRKPEEDLQESLRSISQTSGDSGLSVLVRCRNPHLRTLGGRRLVPGPSD